MVLAECREMRFALVGPSEIFFVDLQLCRPFSIFVDGQFHIDYDLGIDLRQLAAWVQKEPGGSYIFSRLIKCCPH